MPGGGQDRQIVKSTEIALIHARSGDAPALRLDKGPRAQRRQAKMVEVGQKRQKTSRFNVQLQPRSIPLPSSSGLEHWQPAEAGSSVDVP